MNPSQNENEKNVADLISTLDEGVLLLKETMERQGLVGDEATEEFFMKAFKLLRDFRPVTKKLPDEEIPDDLVCKMRDWLGKDGIEFFEELLKEHGTILAVYMEGSIPHPVHFREGMQVRNFLRKHVDWSCEKLDNHWDEVVLKALDRESV